MPKVIVDLARGGPGVLDMARPERTVRTTQNKSTEERVCSPYKKGIGDDHPLMVCRAESRGDT